MHPSARRQGTVVVTVALCLLSVSCVEKKAAMMPHKAFLQSSASSRFYNFADVSGGGGGGEDTDKYPASALASSGQPDNLANRKIVRNGSLDLLVNNVAQSIEKIGSVVNAAGGFIEKSTQTNSSGHSASVTVRVPAARLDQVISQESVAARDVTREYIDLDARLRNALAEEAQYLQILKRATTIKDTLDVTEKLSDVRGRIEQMQGEMKFLTAQIDMSTLEISIHAEAEAAVAGIHWRPLRQAKIAVSEMAAGMTDWVDSVIAFIINLPLIAVWFLSIVALIVAAVRILRFLWRLFGPKINWRLPWKKPAPPVSTPGPVS